MTRIWQSAVVIPARDRAFYCVDCGTPYQPEDLVRDTETRCRWHHSRKEEAM